MDVISEYIHCIVGMYGGNDQVHKWSGLSRKKRSYDARRKQRRVREIEMKKRTCD